MQEMAHIANGRETGNCVSLLRVNVSIYLLNRVFSTLVIIILI